MIMDAGVWEGSKKMANQGVWEPQQKEGQVGDLGYHYFGHMETEKEKGIMQGGQDNNSESILKHSTLCFKACIML